MGRLKVNLADGVDKVIDDLIPSRNGYNLGSPTAPFQNLYLAGAVVQSVATGISAAGSASGDATLLSKAVNNVTTVAASAGVRLFDADVGAVITVRNGGANALAVYPETGGTINGGGVDASVSVAVGATAILIKVAALTWIASEIPAA